MIFRSVAEVKSRDSNEQIGEWNDAADFPGFRIDLSGKLSHLLRKRLKRKDRKSTRLNSSHSQISYAVFCLKKKKWFDLCDVPMIDSKVKQWRALLTNLSSDEDGRNVPAIELYKLLVEPFEDAIHFSHQLRN